MGADTVDLKATAQTEGALLHVSYSLTNHGSASIISFDGAKGTGAGEFLDITGQCYVSLRSPGVASILRVRPPMHPDIDQTVTKIPAVAEVKPGETRQVKFSLPLPLREVSEFSPHFPEAKYRRESIQRLEVVIGYFERQPATKLTPLGAPNVWRVSNPAPLSATQRISALTNVSLELDVRTDAAFIRI